MSLITNLVPDCYSVFLLISPPLSSGISYIIYPPLNNPGPPLVDHLNHYLSTCPIEHPYRPFVSWGNQDSTIQGSSLHKCGQGVSCRAFKAVVPAFSWIFPSSHLVPYIHSAYPYQHNFLECHSNK